MKVNVLNLIDYEKGKIITFVLKENANFEEIRKAVVNEYCLSFGKKSYEQIIREKFNDLLLEVADTQEMNNFYSGCELER